MALGTIFVLTGGILGIAAIFVLVLVSIVLEKREK